MFNNIKFVMPLSLGLGFALTAFLLHYAAKYLPKDGGRAFAVEGQKSAGKPRGAGFVFILVFIAVVALFAPMSLMFVSVLIAYLWFNATPSKLMMGDAGSRAIGLFLAICALKCGDPFIYILLCLVFILDGGLGLLKVFLLRFLKIHILKNVRRFTI